MLSPGTVTGVALGPNRETQIGGQPPGELLRTIGIELVDKCGEA